MNNILRMRFDDAQEYIDAFSQFRKEDIELLGKLTQSSTLNNKLMMPSQKIVFIDLISGYNANNLDKSKIHQMAQDGKIDIAKLQMDLFKGVLQNCGMDEEEISKIPKEKLTSWDLRYIHGLAKTINEAEDKTIFKDLLYAANFDDFKRYIQDESNIYGKTNARTKDIFEENNMDYDKWLNPNSENNIKFIAKDSNQEQLEQVISNLTEDIEALRETALKNKIDKQYKDCIKENNFVISNKYSLSKAKLQTLVENLLKYLESRC